MRWNTPKKLALSTLFAALSFGASAQEEQSSFIVKMSNYDNSAEHIKAAPWIGSYSFISPHYLRISVADENIDPMRSWLSQYGYSYERDVSVKRPVVSGSKAYRYDTRTQTNNTFNDPKISSQTALTSTLNNFLSGMEYHREKNKKNVKVVIMDTGHLAHEDIEHVGGYSFVSSPINENRPPSDYEDYTGQPTGGCVSGHGLEMAGVIGALQNNSTGIAGISNVDVYHARVLQTDCVSNPGSPEDTGRLSDLAAALSDIGPDSDSGIPLPDVVNISLAADTSSCPNYLQQSIDNLYKQGTVIVVSAGNDGSLVSEKTPANCENVVVVGAHDENGNIASYSNYGAEIDVTVIGDRFTTVKNNDYGSTVGTSSSAAAVSGLAALVRQQFPQASPEKIEDLIKRSARKLDDVSGCGTQCRQDMVDADLALKNAEKLIDPKFTFHHAFMPHSEKESGSACELNRERKSLSSFIDSCGSIVAHAEARYVEVDSPVDYQYRLIRRDVGINNWNIDAEKISSKVFLPEVGKDAFPVSNVDFEKYEYAMGACYESDDEVICPELYIKQLIRDDTSFPESCL